MYPFVAMFTEKNNAYAIFGFGVDKESFINEHAVPSNALVQLIPADFIKEASEYLRYITIESGKA